jgi:hypothetical protein
MMYQPVSRRGSPAHVASNRDGWPTDEPARVESFLRRMTWAAYYLAGVMVLAAVVSLWLDA